MARRIAALALPGPNSASPPAAAPAALSRLVRLRPWSQRLWLADASLSSSVISLLRVRVTRVRLLVQLGAGGFALGSSKRRRTAGVGCPVRAAAPTRARRCGCRGSNGGRGASKSGFGVGYPTSGYRKRVSRRLSSCARSREPFISDVPPRGCRRGSRHRRAERRSPTLSRLAARRPCQ